jgi:hypothetical protein
MLADHRVKNKTQKIFFSSLEEHFVSSTLFYVINNINIFVLKK